MAQAGSGAQVLPKDQEGDLDKFLDELAGVDVHEDEVEEASWHEVDSIGDVISAPESLQTCSPAEGTPAGSRADSPPVHMTTGEADPGGGSPWRAAQQAPAVATSKAPSPAPAAAAASRAAAPYADVGASVAVPSDAASTPTPSSAAAVAPASDARLKPPAWAPRTGTAAGSTTASLHAAGIETAVPPATGSAAGTAAGRAPAASTRLRPSTAAMAAGAVLPPNEPGTAGAGTAKASLPATGGAALAKTTAAQPAAPAAAKAASTVPVRHPAACLPAVTRPAIAAPSGLKAVGSGSAPAGEQESWAAPSAGAGPKAAAGPVGNGEEIQVQAEGEEGEMEQQGPRGGGGWGTWGAFGKLGGTLRAAVKDVSELTESFQQVLQDIANAPDEEEGEAAEPSGASASTSAPRLPAQQPQAPQEEEEEILTEEELARRQAVLARLEGEDTQLDKRIKVVDRQVEQISAGAGKALSSLWGWGATLAQRVEQVASTAAKELAETVQEASPAWGTAANGLADAGKPVEGLGLGERLGQLGRSARGFLELGIQGPGRKGQQAGKDEVMSFDECFYIYGGQQAFEELEALSNECARLCNRVRSRLPDDDKANLDKVLAQLAPLFELGAELPGDGAAHQEGAPAALARGHAVISDLAAAGCSRADAMAHAASQKVDELLAPPPAPAEEGAAGTEARGVAGEAAASTAAAAAQAATMQMVPEQKEPSPAAVKALKSIQGEGVKRIAEVSSLCIERLQALSRSVSAQFRYGRPANDGVDWPAAPDAKALLLRGQALKMLGELDAVADSFASALLGTGRALNARSERKVFAKLSEEMVPELSAAAASGRVQEAVKALMYVVWLTSVDRELVE